MSSARRSSGKHPSRALVVQFREGIEQTARLMADPSVSCLHHLRNMRS